MELLSEKDLALFFEQNNYYYKNSAGMEIGLYEKKDVWTLLRETSHNESYFSRSIYTEGDSLQDFINAFEIKILQDIDQLNYISCWKSYLKGSASIIINPMELEADIWFKIVYNKTIIFSLDLHFYDEMYEHLTQPEDFKKYIKDHERQLQTANENRYRVSRN